MEMVFVRLDLEAFAFGRLFDGALEMLTTDPGCQFDRLGYLLTRSAAEAQPRLHSPDGMPDAA